MRSTKFVQNLLVLSRSCTFNFDQWCIYRCENQELHIKISVITLISVLIVQIFVSVRLSTVVNSSSVEICEKDKHFLVRVSLQLSVLLQYCFK